MRMVIWLRRYQKTVDYVLLTLTAYFTFLVRSFLQEQNYSPKAYNLASIFLLFALAVTIEYFKRRILNSRFLDKRQKITGNWIERVVINGTIHIALFDIYYDYSTDQFMVSGNLFDPRRRLAVSRWDSLSVNFIGENTIYYGYHAEIRRENKTTFGTVRLTFLEIRGVTFEGDGYVIDSDPDTKVYNFDFERLTKDLMNSLIGKNEYTSPEERFDLIKKYAEKTQNTHSDVESGRSHSGEN